MNKLAYSVNDKILFNIVGYQIGNTTNVTEKIELIQKELDEFCKISSFVDRAFVHIMFIPYSSRYKNMHVLYIKDLTIEQIPQNIFCINGHDWDFYKWITH